MGRASTMSGRVWRAAVVLGLFTAGLGIAESSTASAADPPPDRSPDRSGGQQAIDRLSSRLVGVAAEHGMSPAQLRSRLLTDRTLFVDGSDQLLYVDPARAPGAPDASPLDPSIADADTFLLHSRPGANKVLFIDFDGQSLSGTAWNQSTGGTCYAEPYDTDGAPGSFSTAELAVVQSVWKRVAEDYAPLDVDVTTQDPGYDAINRSASTDLVFGTRLLVTKSVSPCPNGKTLYASVCAGGCGGVAYVGVYDSTGATHDYYQPALVFQNGVSGAKNIAEAASHEVGHNAGLGHDGTSTSSYYQGHGSWAPIMGVGYSRAIVQWSRGEYTGANNTEDDFVVMGSNGLGVRGDDHGNDAANATALSGTVVAVDGVISTRTDLDAFTFGTGAGPVSFTVSPALTSPNLDVRLELRDSLGALVDFSDPASGSTGSDASTGMGASISTSLAAGTYTLLVDGVGYANPSNTGYSDYGSLGNYRLTGSTVGTDGAPPIAVVSATPTSGTAPVTVAFVGSGSSDPEGGALTYAWSFGDGAGASNLADPTYTYTSPGTYTATLTVTDPTGLSSSASVVVTVSVPTPRIDVAAIGVTGTQGSRVNATATVTVRDASGVLSSGVKVTGKWYAGATLLSTRSSTTTTSGVATLKTGNVRAASGTAMTFCVTALVKSGLPWDITLFAPVTEPDCATWTVP